MKWQKQFSAYEIELQTSHRIRGEISVQSVIRRKAQRDRKNPAAVVRMEKGGDYRSGGVSRSHTYAS